MRRDGYCPAAAPKRSSTYVAVRPHPHRAKVSCAPATGYCHGFRLGVDGRESGPKPRRRDRDRFFVGVAHGFALPFFFMRTTSPRP
jgi:hypothetical protein